MKTNILEAIGDPKYDVVKKIPKFLCCNISGV